MAYALVGTIGTAVQGTSGGTASPTFGTGESRTAGNLLVCWVSVCGSATLPTTPSGWSIYRQRAGTTCSATVYTKVAAGSDTAPVIALIASGVIAAQLAEFSGWAGTEVTQAGDNVGTSSPVTATFAGADGQTGALLLCCSADFRSVARATADTWTSNNATITLAGNNNGVSSVNHYSFGYDVTTANGSADTATITLSITTSITGIAVAGGASVVAPPPGVGFPYVGGAYYGGFWSYVERIKQRRWRLLPRPVAIFAAPKGYLSIDRQLKIEQPSVSLSVASSRNPSAD